MPQVDQKRFVKIGRLINLSLRHLLQKIIGAMTLGMTFRREAAQWIAEAKYHLNDSRLV